MVRVLIVEGRAKVNYGTPDEGFTPLMLAAAYGHGHVLRLLLDLGANVNQGNKSDGATVPP